MPSDDTPEGRPPAPAAIPGREPVAGAAPSAPSAPRERSEPLERERAARLSAEAAVRVRDEILAIVSHDLRNPLHSIALCADLLKHELPAAERERQTAIILRAVERMSRLIQDLLDVDQATAGRLRVDPAPLDLAALVTEVTATLRPQLTERGQKFGYEVPQPGSVIVRADRTRVTQVLTNLVSNASKFTAAEGNVRVRAERAAGEALLQVVDNGCGIEPQHLRNIFERFWQEDRVRRGGVGLGLAISRGIVEAHGGRIWVESEPGAGTTVSFTLPLAAPQAT